MAAQMAAVIALLVMRCWFMVSVHYRDPVSETTSVYVVVACVLCQLPGALPDGCRPWVRTTTLEDNCNERQPRRYDPAPRILEEERLVGDAKKAQDWQKLLIALMNALTGWLVGHIPGGLGWRDPNPARAAFDARQDEIARTPELDRSGEVLRIARRIKLGASIDQAKLSGPRNRCQSRPPRLESIPTTFSATAQRGLISEIARTHSIVRLPFPPAIPARLPASEKSWQGGPPRTTSTLPAKRRKSTFEISERFGTWGQRSANKAHAAGSISAKATGSHPSAILSIAIEGASIPLNRPM